MAALYVDVEVGRRAQEILVIVAHRVEDVVVLGPRLVIVEAARSEGGHQAIEIVSIFESNVLFDPLQAPRCDRIHGVRFIRRGAKPLPRANRGQRAPMAFR